MGENNFSKKKINMWIAFIFLWIEMKNDVSDTKANDNWTQIDYGFEIKVTDTKQYWGVRNWLELVNY